MKVPQLPVRILLERLLLRPLRWDDAESLHIALSDPEVMRYWSSGPSDNAKATHSYIAGNMPDGEYPSLAIVERSAGDNAPAIGWVMLSKSREGIGEIGYILRADKWRQGYGCEAVTAMIAHGFDAMGYRKIIADVDPDNAPSLRMLDKLGFQREGVLRAHWETHIGIRDSVMLGLLKSEWEDSVNAQPAG